MARGFVSAGHGDFVLRGLTDGFDLGVDLSLVKGKRWFNNYKSAWEARDAVSTAIAKRLEARKTVCLGLAPKRDVKTLPWESCRVFPLGAVSKPLEPGVMRPVSDHTRTGLKEATDMEAFRHSLNTYEEIATFLKSGYVMRMSDIDGAFPLLPLAPKLWPFFLFWWCGVSDMDKDKDDMFLFAQVCGDFGAAGLPGTWKIFFSDVMVGVARSEAILTLPCPIYVDDLSLIGPHIKETNKEGKEFGEWLAEHGVYTKALKDRGAAQLQLALGFWWDSVRRTRQLEAKKKDAYLEHLQQCAQAKVLTLREMQKVGGRMQRAVLTLPRGANCFLGEVYALMRGLRYPWQKRRTNAGVRECFRSLAELLGENLGMGYFCTKHLAYAPDVYTDASKESTFAGGGYFSECGRFDFWQYGTSARRLLIDQLEGDAVLVAAQDLRHLWAGKIVRLHIDNRAFQLSAAKGWSKAVRMLRQLKTLFHMAVEVGCVLEFLWISTKDNVLADHLSRQGGLERFYVDAEQLFPSAPLQPARRQGATRAFGPEYPDCMLVEGNGA